MKYQIQTRYNAPKLTKFQKEEKSTIIKSLDTKKAEDISNFPIKIIKDLVEYISEPLAQIFNF